MFYIKTILTTPLQIMKWLFQDTVFIQIIIFSCTKPKGLEFVQQQKEVCLCKGWHMLEVLSILLTSLFEKVRQVQQAQNWQKIAL